MKMFLLLSVLSLSSLSAMVRTGVEFQSSYDDGYYGDDGVYYQEWYGPGLYNGIWFNNRWDRDDWHRNHRHNYPHHRYRNGGNHGRGHH